MISSSLTVPVPLSPQPPTARRQVGEILRQAAWPGDVDAVILCVHEALVNAERHGGGVTRASVAVEGNAVVVTVSDCGSGYTLPDSPNLPDAAAERGRGLFLIRRLASRADVSRVSREVRLQLRFEC